MEVCQHQPKQDTHLKDGIHGASGGTKIESTTKYTTAGNQTIYAQWQIITYQVTYNANGGSGAPGAQTKTWGQSLPLSSQKPTRSGYTFVNWNTQANGTGTSYNSGANYTANAGVTLYAQWKQNGVLATTAITSANYGESVNYSANGITNWKLFLNDGTKIYIIAGDYVPTSGMKFGKGISAGIGAYGVKADSKSNLLNWLKGTSNWTEYAKSISGATATGGPTLGQFVKSYNKKYSKNYSESTEQSSGFIINITDTLYNPHAGSELDGCYGYWLASDAPATGYPWTVWNMHCKYLKIFDDDYSAGYYGLRPLVCMPSDIYAKKENNKWTFSK